MKRLFFLLVLPGLLLMVAGCKKSDSTDPPPVVKDPYGMFTYSKKANGIVTFTNTSTDATSYLWDFGDGKTSTTAEKTFDHQYLQNGTYHATLTAYGNGKSAGAYADLNITTVVGGVPTVETDSITNITRTSATAGGNVTSEGGSLVTARGVCWSKSQNPTINDNKTIDGSGTGSFTSNITGLTKDTWYYVKSYAINSAGTSFGDQLSFKTNSDIGPQPCPDIPTVTYVGQIYNTVQIGTQCWFKENLNYQTGNSWCYDDNTTNCDTYGRLYDWQTALGVCPSGWHLPSDAEWTALTDFLGGGSVAGGKMKEAGTTHWSSPNTGATNSSGFSALPGGFRNNDGSFGHLTNYAYFWSSTEHSSTFSTGAWCRLLDNSSEWVSPFDFDWQNGFSARCVKD